MRMTKFEAALLTLIARYPDPEKAIKTAVNVINNFLKTTNPKEVSK